MTAAPSDNTPPSRILSKGLLAFAGSPLNVVSSLDRQKAANVISFIGASNPPVMMVFAPPVFIIWKAYPMAFRPAVHPVERVIEEDFSPSSLHIVPAGEWIEEAESA